MVKTILKWVLSVILALVCVGAVIEIGRLVFSSPTALLVILEVLEGISLFCLVVVATIVIKESIFKK